MSVELIENKGCMKIQSKLKYFQEKLVCKISDLWYIAKSRKRNEWQQTFKFQTWSGTICRIARRRFKGSSCRTISLRFLRIKQTLAFQIEKKKESSGNKPFQPDREQLSICEHLSNCATPATAIQEFLLQNNHIEIPTNQANMSAWKEKGIEWQQTFPAWSGAIIDLSNCATTIDRPFFKIRIPNWASCVGLVS